MFCYLMTAFTALLFVALTPGVLLTLPSKASGKLVIALVHGLIFALVYHLIHKTVKGVINKYEGFDDDDDDDPIEGFAPFIPIFKCDRPNMWYAPIIDKVTGEKTCRNYYTEHKDYYNKCVGDNVNFVCATIKR